MGQCLCQRHVWLPDKHCRWLQHSLSLRVKPDCSTPRHEGDKRDTQKKRGSRPPALPRSRLPGRPPQTLLSRCHHPLNFYNRPRVPSPLLSLCPPRPHTWLRLPLAHVVWCSSYSQYTSTPTRNSTSASSSLKPLLHPLPRKILGSALGWRSCH